MNHAKFTAPACFVFDIPLAQNTLFLDRDGVLNDVVMRDSEISSPRNLEEFQLAEDLGALREFEVRKNWNIVVITNQPDLTRGKIDFGLLEKFHNEIHARISLNAVYICPHLKSDCCDCRKPAMGLIQRFHQDFPHLKGRELFVGDRICDRECAKLAQIPFVLRKRSYNRELYDNSPYVINHLSEVQSLLKMEELT